VISPALSSTPRCCERLPAVSSKSARNEGAFSPWVDVHAGVDAAMRTVLFDAQTSGGQSASWSSFSGGTARMEAAGSPQGREDHPPPWPPDGRPPRRNRRLRQRTAFRVQHSSIASVPPSSSRYQPARPGWEAHVPPRRCATHAPPRGGTAPASR
jgi:hypothetical protein